MTTLFLCILGHIIQCILVVGSHLHIFEVNVRKPQLTYLPLDSSEIQLDVGVVSEFEIDMTTQHIDFVTFYYNVVNVCIGGIVVERIAGWQFDIATDVVENVFDHLA
jgi:hypothetical protein